MDPSVAASQLRAFRRMCPYLGRTSPATLRTMSTTSIAGVTRLRIRAQACPVLGSALTMESQPAAADKRQYASMAGPAEIDEIHRRSGVDARSTGAGVCPHAALARAAADQVAQERAKLNKAAAARPAVRKVPEAVPAAPVSHAKAAQREGFNYERFYEAELDKKHQDKSYR